MRQMQFHTKQCRDRNYIEMSEGDCSPERDTTSLIGPSRVTRFAVLRP